MRLPSKMFAVEFLPITIIGHKVQKIILNLKSRSEKETEADKLLQRRASA